MMIKQTPENLVKQQIKDWLTAMGFFQFHIIQGFGCYKGLPDRIAIKKGNVLFIEVKGPKGKLSEWQQTFKEDIEAAGGHYIEARGYEDIENYLKEREGVNND